MRHLELFANRESSMFVRAGSVDPVASEKEHRAIFGFVCFIFELERTLQGASSGEFLRCGIESLLHTDARTHIHTHTHTQTDTHTWGWRSLFRHTRMFWWTCVWGRGVGEHRIKLRNATKELASGRVFAGDIAIFVRSRYVGHISPSADMSQSYCLTDREIESV